MAKTIGFVLTAYPKYSESFLLLKFEELQKRGFKILLFVDNLLDAPGNRPYECIEGFSLGGNYLRVFEHFMRAVFRIFRNPGIGYKLFRWNRINGRSNKESIKSVFLCAHMFSRRIDIIHFSFSSSAMFREGLGTTMKLKTIVSLRGFDINVVCKSAPSKFKLIWDSIDYVHSISSDLISKAHRFGLPLSKSSLIIVPAVNLELFNDCSSIPLNSESSVFKIISVSRLHWIKGVDLVLLALSIFNERSNIDFEYTILGAGVELNRLQELTRGLGLESKVNFQGAKSKTDVIKELNSSNLLIQYSINEGYCNAVLEGRAAKVPCIVSDVGGLKENIKDGETGFVVRGFRPDLLAEKILDVSKMPKIDLDLIVSNSYSDLKVTNSLDQHISDWIKLYKNV